jgi:2-oxoglutarate dehydrogenase E1 component
MKTPKELAEQVCPAYDTGIDLNLLKHIGHKISAVPEGFHLHSNLSRILKARKVSVDEGHHIDWATAELMAYGSLLLEGNHVRLSGQVCF